MRGEFERATMAIPFLKVQGAGNDFVLVDARGPLAERLELDWAAAAPKICDRHFGVGADGILLVEDTEAAAARMTIVNADGSDGQMCGNGFRCFTKYLIERAGIAPTDGRLAIETGAGVLHAELGDAGESGEAGGEIEQVRVAVGPAYLEPDQIPVRASAPGPILLHRLRAAGREFNVTCVGMGNPHAVCFIDDDVDEFPLAEVGPVVEHHPDFPERVNFEIVNALAPDHLKMRVWERGVGETMACGSGACAVLVAARLRGLADALATVSLPGGDLQIAWDGPEAASVYMTGPAEFAFEGAIPSEWIPNGHA